MENDKILDNKSPHALFESWVMGDHRNVIYTLARSEIPVLAQFVAYSLGALDSHVLQNIMLRVDKKWKAERGASTN